MAIIDKIQLSGTVYTIGNETTTAVTSASTDNEIPTAKAVYDAIPKGGGGGESCTVDSTAIFYTFSRRYSNDALDMMARYAVLDYGQNKTEIPNLTVEVNFRDIDYIPYVSQTIQLDYSTSSYTLGDISQAEYIDVTYDSTINDFKIAVATAYTSTVFIDYINFLNGNIKVPFYTISSGSPCTAIENDIPTAMSELGNNMLKGLKEIDINSRQDAISIYTNTIGGDDNSRKIRLDEIDGSNSTLKPDIYVGLGTIGWTEINLSDQCTISSLKSTKYRVTYNNNSELYAYFMGLQFIVEYAGKEVSNQVNFDETKHPSLQTTDLFSAATLDWNDSTMELVITYPETIELYGKQESVNIREIYSNGCNFGNAITKLESYGEVKQALKPYVKETRAALSGKQDTLVSGTNIKTINGETLLGEGNITIQGGSGGGKAIEAGRGISITTGETADTINCTLNLENGTNSESGGIKLKSDAAGNEVRGRDACAFGGGNHANGINSFVTGYYNTGNTDSSFISGYKNKTTNNMEVLFGMLALSNGSQSSDLNGNSGCTLFAVGNGEWRSQVKHNAFEIRQNGDIYIADTNDTSTTNYYEKPMIKLQDALGGGGSSYTAGDGIDITNDVISVTGKVDTSAFTAHTADTVIHVTSAEKADWNNKQDTLVSGTNIKTINGETLLGEGNITIQGGSGGVNVVQTTGTSTADVMSQDAVTKALRNTNLVTTSYSSGLLDLEYKDPFNTKYRTMLKFGTINGMTIANIGSARPSFSLVETSAITTSVTSSSTDSQVPSAKAVYDQFGGLKLVKLTKSEYDSLTTKDSQTLYIIVN